MTVRKKQGKGLKSRKYESKGSVTTSAQRADGQSDLLCPQRSAVCPASGSTAYCRQVSRDIWRAAARAEGKMAHNLFNSTNCRCFSGEGKLVDFVNFTFTKGSLLLPRGLKIEQVEGTERRFRVSWQEEREWATATGSDLLQIGVLYDSLPLGPRLAVSVSGRRQDLCGEFTLSERATDGAHVYCFFAREDGSAYSDCQYFRISAIPSHPQHTT